MVGTDATWPSYGWEESLLACSIGPKRAGRATHVGLFRRRMVPVVVRLHSLDIRMQRMGVSRLLTGRTVPSLTDDAVSVSGKSSRVQPGVCLVETFLTMRGSETIV